ncbi:MAG: Uma2 family endonuclease [Acetobacteraceae bacterium]|nr:Uma2 family endonuclease [Acetobacteraceae bacterium]
MTMAEFLEWEERQELRYEFDGYAPVAITGGTVAHDLITFNLRKALDTRLAGKPYQSFGPNVKMLVAGRVRYPDGVVVCGPVNLMSTIIDAPVVVFEVLSSDTARTDRIEKLREYQSTPSIQRYVMIEQRSVGATVVERRGDIWTVSVVTAGGTLQMPEIGIEVQLDELYIGLDLPAEEESDR